MNMSRTDDAWYSLRNAVYAGEFAVAGQMLREQPSLLHATNQLGETVLHFLAVENDLKGVSWLHARGADISTKNAFGTPVVFEVALLGYKELFRWFVEKGADTLATDEDGQNVVLYLLDHEHAEMATWVRNNGA